MTLLPEWAPNIHPVLIHFPIVLLLLAPLLDLAAIVFQRQLWLRKNANLVYALAGFSLLIVYISGRLAADSVNLPSSAYTTLSTHADWALYTLILGGLNAVLRGSQLFQKKQDRSFQWYLVLPGLVVAGLLLFTADKGAKLVYGHGVGVNSGWTEVTHELQQEDHSHGGSAEHSPGEAPSQSAGSNESMLDPGQRFEWLLGTPENLNHVSEQDGSLLSLALDNQEVLFVLPEIFDNLEFTTSLNLDEFKGTVRLVHHVSATRDYDFLELKGDAVKQGRNTGGKLVIFDTAEYSATGWVDLKVVSTKGHFRGYINGELMTHGHGSDVPAGKQGVYVKGSGLIRLTAMLVQGL